jgi:hypothetical protein
MLDLTSHWVGWAVLCIFLVAYALVILEERSNCANLSPSWSAPG